MGHVAWNKTDDDDDDDSEIMRRINSQIVEKVIWHEYATYLNSTNSGLYI